MLKTKVVVVLIMGIAFIAILASLPSIIRIKEEHSRRTCTSNLKEIGLSLHMYSMDNNGQLPPNLGALYPRYIEDLRIFVCPMSSETVSEATEIDDKGSYVYIPGYTSKDDPDTLIVYEKSHPGSEGRYELYLNGHVTWKGKTK